VPLRPGGATCPVDEWAAVERAEQFRRWIDQRPHSLISLYPRYATDAAALHTVGRGSNNLLSGGLYRQPHAPDPPQLHRVDSGRGGFESAQPDAVDGGDQVQ
jgi:hypothetical protein